MFQLQRVLLSVSRRIFLEYSSPPWVKYILNFQCLVVWCQSMMQQPLWKVWLPYIQSDPRAVWGISFFFFFNLSDVGRNFLSLSSQNFSTSGQVFLHVLLSYSNSFLGELLWVFIETHDLLPHFFQDVTFLFCFAWVSSLRVMWF